MPSTLEPLSYRRATPADAGVLAALATSVWITTYCEQGIPRAWAEYVQTEFTMPAFATALADPEAAFWLAEAADGPVAFVDLRLGARTPSVTDLRPAEVARLYVLERFARRGIGHALLQHCHATAAAAGVTTLWLAMYAGNDRARTFYHALGWRKVGDLAFRLGGQSYPNDVFAIAVAMPAER